MDSGSASAMVPDSMSATRLVDPLMAAFNFDHLAHIEGVRDCQCDVFGESYRPIGQACHSCSKPRLLQIYLANIVLSLQIVLLAISFTNR